MPTTNWSPPRSWPREPPSPGTPRVPQHNRAEAAVLFDVYHRLLTAPDMCCWAGTMETLESLDTALAWFARDQQLVLLRELVNRLPMYSDGMLAGEVGARVLAMHLTADEAVSVFTYYCQSNIPYAELLGLMGMATVLFQSPSTGQMIRARRAVARLGGFSTGKRVELANTIVRNHWGTGLVRRSSQAGSPSGEQSHIGQELVDAYPDSCIDAIHILFSSPATAAMFELFTFAAHLLDETDDMSPLQALRLSAICSTHAEHIQDPGSVMRCLECIAARADNETALATCLTMAGSRRSYTREIAAYGLRVLASRAESATVTQRCRDALYGIASDTVEFVATSARHELACLGLNVEGGSTSSEPTVIPSPVAVAQDEATGCCIGNGADDEVSRHGDPDALNSLEWFERIRFPDWYIGGKVTFGKPSAVTGMIELFVEQWDNDCVLRALSTAAHSTHVGAREIAAYGLRLLAVRERNADIWWRCVRLLHKLAVDDHPSVASASRAQLAQMRSPLFGS